MIDTYSIIYSPEARDDLKDIYSYIAFDLLVPGIAEGQVNRIRKTIRSLDSMPSRFSIVDWNRGKAWGCIKYSLTISSFFMRLMTARWK